MPFVQREGCRLWVGGPLPSGWSAFTVGRMVIVSPEAAESPYVMRHEQVHVRQWRRHGVVGYPVRYGAWYVVWRMRRKGHQGALRRVPLEVEADWVARRSLGTAVPDAVGAATPAR